ncbi:peptidylprolyl isomerase [Thermocrinis minervae]|uniref:Peptidyl-prolyl cis-trans isomerase SurA n=1 Tax=Thermocrinis minervae TaxID=381751 RepID=A0A1M6SUM8_9AQUI|nr:peptidylprolyl isomerase [Thermocrinis minervae]SHK48340.1 peptidyl-prolyl cis-trans isomerase SurA [Thermocrinis minervae]
MVFRGVKEVSLGVLLWLLLIGFSLPAVLVDKVVASVNGQPITEKDLKLGALFYNTNDRKEILNRLIDTYLLYQYMASKGFSVPESYLEEAMKNMAKSNNMDVETLAKELSKDGFTLKELADFLGKQILATAAFREYLMNQIKVSDVDLELERLKKGKVKVLRRIELLVVDKKDREKLLKSMEKTVDLESLAKELGVKPEVIDVQKGDLVEPLDREVWKASVGSMVVAEDAQNVYIAKVLQQKEVYDTADDQTLKQEILQRKLSQEQENILRDLKKKSIIKIVDPGLS